MLRELKPMIYHEASPLTLQAHDSRYPRLTEFLRVAYSSILGQIRSDKTVNSGGAASLAARLCSAIGSLHSSLIFSVGATIRFPYSEILLFPCLNELGIRQYQY